MEKNRLIAFFKAGLRQRLSPAAGSTGSTGSHQSFLASRNIGNRRCLSSSRPVASDYSCSQPNPNWKPGERIKSPVEEMVQVDPKLMGVAGTYKLMIGCIVPRPIAFVSTTNAAGQSNLAPFSFFNGVSSNPPALMFSITTKPNGEIKDTLRNILETKQFVVNTVAEWMAEPMNYCSGEFPYGINEMEKAGLTPIPSMLVKPPRCKESPVHFECSLLETLQVGKGVGSGTIVVGKIELIHVHKPALTEKGHVLLEEIKPISRLAGTSYGKTTEVFDIKRPKVSVSDV